MRGKPDRNLLGCQGKRRAESRRWIKKQKAWKVLKVRPCLPDRAVFVKDFCIFDNLTGCPNVKRRRDSYQPRLPGRFCSGQRPYSSFTRKFGRLFHEVIGGCSPLCKFPTLVYECYPQATSRIPISEPTWRHDHFWSMTVLLPYWKSMLIFKYQQYLFGYSLNQNSGLFVDDLFLMQF